MRLDPDNVDVAVISGPNPADHAGFPPLIAAVSSGRADPAETLRFVLQFGGEPTRAGLTNIAKLPAVAE